MAHQRDARHIYFAVERIAFGLVPFAPEFQMFKEHPAANGLLFGRIMEETAIQKIFIDRGEDNAATGEQFTKIGVPRVGEIGHVVIPVDDESKRKWTGPFRIPDAGVQRKLIYIKAPVFFARPALPAFEIWEEVG